MKTKTVFIAFFLFSLGLAKATHNRAGEILYKRIAPYVSGSGTNTVAVYNYSITVIKYTDDGQNIADRCVDTVYFGDGTKGIAARINGPTTCGCGTFSGTTVACGSLIVNSPGYTVKYNVYSVTHTYPGPGSYLIRSFDPNRNSGIHNIPNSVNLPFYIESLLIITAFTGANSSVVLTNPPIDQATVGVCFYHNVGAVDADGDSLSYEITTCRGENGQSVPGYSFPDAGWGGTFSINPVSGLLTWCSPQLIAEFQIAILVKEWRKNTSGTYAMIGSVLRDMQILVKFGGVGIAENEATRSLIIYPNPFTEILEVDLNGNTDDQVESFIYTGDGRLVVNTLSEKVNGKLNLPVTSLERGIYLLQVRTKNGVLFQKVVKN